MDRKTPDASSRMRILLYKGESKYGSLRHFTDSLRRGFRSLGVRVSVFDETREVDGDYFAELFHRSRPTLTVGFNIWRAQIAKRELYDRLNLPHLALFVDHPVYLFPDFHNPGDSRLLIGCVDRSHVDFLRSRFKKEEVFFFSHGCVQPAGHRPPDYARRKIDILFPASLGYGRETLPAPEVLGPDLQRKVDELVESFPPPAFEIVHHLLDNALDQIGRSLPDELYCRLACFLDRRMRALDRFRLLEGVQDFPIAVAGDTDPRQVGLGGRIEYRGPYDYADLVKLLGNTRMMINRMPRFREGSHERVLEGMAAGCLVLTDESTYLKERFTSGEDLVFYDPDNPDDLRGKIDYFLRNRDEAAEIAASGRSKALAGHTWTQTAESILRSLRSFPVVAGGAIPGGGSDQ